VARSLAAAAPVGQSRLAPAWRCCCCCCCSCTAGALALLHHVLLPITPITARWEAEVDWMALQGVNLPLMPLGMEALLAQTFVGLGLQEAQLADFFPGPAFLAWVRGCGCGGAARLRHARHALAGPPTARRCPA
jgi:hypothetical protein